MGKAVIFVIVLLMCCVCSSANSEVVISGGNFPDDVFREYVSGFDVDGDGVLSDSELESVRRIDVPNSNIASLQGIEYFPNLIVLVCNGNPLKAIDLSRNTALEALLCSGCQLTELDVSRSTALFILDCSNNPIGTLDISNNTAFTDLDCNSNNLKALDVSMCPYLETLYCYSNDLTALDLSRNIDLVLLRCEDNSIGTLDISKNTALIALTCNNNNLTTFDVSMCPSLELLNCASNNLTVLDVSKNVALDTLFCSNNPLGTLNVSSNTALTFLSCSDNQLSAIDVSMCTSLKELYCYSNAITTVDVSKNSELISLDCGSNRLTELDVSRNAELRQLNCRGNYLTTLDISRNSKLTELSCGENQISSLNLYNNPNLRKLWCYNGILDALDLTGNQAMEFLSCWYNNISFLDLRSNPALTTLYCYGNQISELILSGNPDLEILSCSDNQLAALDLSHNTALIGLDCGRNFITALDVTHNTNLAELYCRVSLVSTLDISRNISLIFLDCSSTDITALSLSNNSALQELDCIGLTLRQHLDILQSGRTDYPYYADIRQYAGNNAAKITKLTAHTKDGTEIHSQFTPSEGIARFASSPVYLLYDYPTEYTGNADSADVQRTITVKLSIPTQQWIYIPHVDPKILDPSDDIHSASEHHESADEDISTPDKPSDPKEQPDIDKPSSSDTIPAPSAPESRDEQVHVSGGSGGGCDSGLGILAAAVTIIFCSAVCRKNKLFVFVLVMCVVSLPAFGENVKASDYVLPVPLEIYTPAGTWTTDFEVTAEFAEKIAEGSSISPDKVHSYSEIIKADSWNFTTRDMYYMAVNGQYAGVMLPVTEYMTSGDYYIIKCIFSDDIQPGEMMSGVSAVEVDPETGNSFYDEAKSYLSHSAVFDENLNPIEAVPENRTIYISVSLHTNTGLVTVVRGKYVEEEDPLNRLDADVAERIAGELGIASSDLKYLTRANIGLPVEPTDAMKTYVKSDDHEIIINLPTISVDEEGLYIVPVTISGDSWDLVQGQSISDFKFYALNDSDLGEGQMRPAFIDGLISTWEIFTLSGERMTTFGVKEFLMVGFLQAGKPFSLYLARLLLALLLGGCSSGITSSAVHAVISSMIIFELLRKR